MVYDLHVLRQTVFPKSSCKRHGIFGSSATFQNQSNDCLIFPTLIKDIAICCRGKKRDREREGKRKEKKEPLNIC